LRVFLRLTDLDLRARLTERFGALGVLEVRRAFLRDLLLLTDVLALGDRLGALGARAALRFLERDRLRLTETERFGAFGTFDLRLDFLRDTDRLVDLDALGTADLRDFLRLTERETDFEAELLGALGVLALRAFLAEREVLGDRFDAFGAFAARRDFLRETERDFEVDAEGDRLGPFGTLDARRLLDLDRDLLTLSLILLLLFFLPFGTLAARLLLERERLVLLDALGTREERFLAFREAEREVETLAEGDLLGPFGTLAARRALLREADREADLLLARGTLELLFFDVDRDTLVDGDRLGALGTFAARRFLRETEREADLFDALGTLDLRLVDFDRDLLADLLGPLGTLALRETDLEVEYSALRFAFISASYASFAAIYFLWVEVFS